jgi:hypothetical protein
LRSLSQRRSPHPASGEAPKLIAWTLTLFPEVITTGESRGKDLTFTFKGKARHCYNLLARFTARTGAEEVESVNWSQNRGDKSLQRYYLSMTGNTAGNVGQEDLHGVCTTKDGPITASASLSYPGTKNSARYVVVGMPKEKFPIYIAAYMTLSPRGGCESEAWQHLWEDPIPGTVVYRGKEPFLIKSAWSPAFAEVNLLDVSGGRASAKKMELSSTPPPSGITFATQFKFEGCNPLSPESPSSQKLAQCQDKVSAKHMGTISAAAQARRAAKTEEDEQAAKATLKEAEAALKAEEDRICKPLQEQIEKEWRATYDKIVALYTRSPPKSAVDRADEIERQHRAAPDRIR